MQRIVLTLNNKPYEVSLEDIGPTLVALSKLRPLDYVYDADGGYESSNEHVNIDIRTVPAESIKIKLF